MLLPSALAWAAGPPDGKVKAPCCIQLQQGVIYMVGKYRIRRGNETVGTATIEKQGLYYRICCRCKVSGEGIRRIVMTCGKSRHDLGICVPIDGAFGMDKRIPCKQIAAGEPEFLLLPKYPGVQGKFIPVYPDEPFAYMTRLKDAYLQVRDGRPGIVIVE